MDIVVWLRSLGLGKYEAVFRENEIAVLAECQDAAPRQPDFCRCRSALALPKKIPQTGESFSPSPGLPPFTSAQASGRVATVRASKATQVDSWSRRDGFG
jgi:hypothetical protein